MTKVQLSQVGAVWATVPSPEPAPHGGTWPTGRTFTPAAVPAPVDEPAAPVEEYLAEHDATPEQPAAMRELQDIVGDSPERAARALELIERVKAAKGCDRLDGQCIEHYVDNDGTVIHHGPTLKVPDPNGTALQLRLTQWHDDPPYLEVEETELDLACLDRLIASLADNRAHLAAALGEAPPTQPPEGEKAQPGGTWTITTANSFTAHGYLPAWAENDPSKYQIPADRLQLHISDVVHARWFDGQEVTTNVPGGDGRVTCPDQLLGGLIVCRPYSDSPVARVPHVNIEVLAGSDEWIEHLDPAGVADVAAKLRAQAARLDQVREQLVEACADWAANGGAQ